VAIIGGGPTGLAALVRLAELGISSSLVIEREEEAGGVPRHCGHWGFGWQSHRRMWRGPQFASELARAARGLDIRTGTTALAIAPDGVIALRDGRGLSQIKARRILVATGTRERSRAARLIAGARPMGVMNTGALQQHVYLKGHRPFLRPAIIGSEWVSFSALLTCQHLGIRPVALIEEEARTSAPAMGALVSRLVFGVPVLTETRLVAIEGKKHVEAIAIESRGKRRHIACDGVIVSGAFVPEDALLTAGIDVATAGNVRGPLKTSGACWLEGRAAAERIFGSLR
ncbi:MAG: pyridine nucleotide-disulfide oxidoreductase, partial [Alphaproteobacteria bacterium]|nr:pyridine nucleotide-disulfide oxidoreductase [Alphaproteobacteria bacterium]